MTSKNVLQDYEIEDLLFLRPPEGSEDELEDLNLDKLICDIDAYDHNDGNIDIIDLPDLDQNIFNPSNDLDSSELANPILIVVPNSEYLNLRPPLVNNTTTVDNINTSKQAKFRQIKSLI
jgi:hypothetical protein